MWWQSVLIAFGVPLIFACCGAMGRKLVRGSPWERKDFYLGVQLSLATFSADILYVVEMLRAPDASSATDGRMTAVLFLVAVFFLYVWLLTLHQDWENRTQDLKGQTIRLMLVSNIAGVLLFAAFVFLVKGVR